ncbi:hypothetical protein [Phenylobacterium sp.]|uniref:hypothetical protein n=1 Tax=Phenylobacterium sp. TaxID=1871053 RepID=UPI002CF2A53C|nr:hypothetical protein [Phenylobacterium sp.]HVI32032.1 hypothetical protein [Phenylobacterium sp.]
MTLRLFALAGLALAFGTAAWAQEPMTTAGASASPPAAESAPAPIADATAAEDRRAREIGDWARGVLEGRPSEETADAASARCPPSDGKPHGQVWAGIGTRGYRTVGGVVTQPLGDCGSVTVGVSRTESDFGRRRR